MTRATAVNFKNIKVLMNLLINLISQQFIKAKRKIAAAASSCTAESGTTQPTEKNGCAIYLANTSPVTALPIGLEIISCIKTDYNHK